jgi:hypothetical protein
MARNLREKIQALVNDAYDLQAPSTVTLIENLIKEELELKNEERTFDFYDLNLINSMAIKEFTDMNPSFSGIGRIAGDEPMVRTLCVVKATVSFLRNKGLLSALLRYEKK